MQHAEAARKGNQALQYHTFVTRWARGKGIQFPLHIVHLSVGKLVALAIILVNFFPLVGLMLLQS